MLGLLRGTVILCRYDACWPKQAQETIDLLRRLLGDAAVDIQHVGSTSISGLSAKPILDIVIGVRELGDLDPYAAKLEQMQIHEAGQDLPGQRLFVMGDFEKNTRTHHIHAVQWNSDAWKNYIRFRDYLRSFEEKRSAYEAEKRRLAGLYPISRETYTMQKAAMIEKLLDEANRWAEERETNG